jgi:chromosome segregation ATPase
LKAQIDEYNQINQSTDKQILRTINDKNTINIDMDNITHDLKYAESKIDGTQREIMATKQDINLVNVEIQNYDRQIEDLKNELERLGMMVNKLQRERNELLADLEGLTNTFVQCKNGIQAEHEDIHHENKWKTKLVVAKILFNDLSQF